MLEKLLPWLNSHSTSSVRNGTELQFFHSTGSSSILLVREEWVDGTLPVVQEGLKSFYSEYWGASIGDGHIVIGTPVEAGIWISHGYQIPDLNEMADTARTLGFPEHPDIKVFMQQASWMFIYGMQQGNHGIISFDRDFNATENCVDIESILDQWWEIEEADARDRGSQ